jgi:hypothetical protein
MAQFIDAIIDENGDITIELNGYVGKGCEAVQEAFNVFGETVEIRKKPEYNQTVKAKVKQR